MYFFFSFFYSDSPCCCFGSLLACYIANILSYKQNWIIIVIHSHDKREENIRSSKACKFDESVIQTRTNKSMNWRQSEFMQEIGQWRQICIVFASMKFLCFCDSSLRWKGNFIEHLSVEVSRTFILLHIQPVCLRAESVVK